MKRLFHIILFFIITHAGFAQGVYFGYPRESAKLQEGDRILLNIPIYRDWYFFPDGGIAELATFISSDTTLFFEIKIREGWGAADYVQRHTEFLAERMTDELLQRCDCHNYTIIGLGKTHPIFLDEKDEKYKAMNTMMEIVVTKKQR